MTPRRPASDVPELAPDRLDALAMWSTRPSDRAGQALRVVLPMTGSVIATLGDETPARTVPLSTREANRLLTRAGWQRTSPWEDDGQGTYRALVRLDTATVPDGADDAISGELALVEAHLALLTSYHRRLLSAQRS